MENRFSGNEKKGRKNGENGENFESEGKMYVQKSKLQGVSRTSSVGGTKKLEKNWE
jgi:hypothetical protein